MPKLQGYVHGIIIKFLRIVMQVANAVIGLSMLQKAAKIHTHTQLFIIRKICPSKTNCVFKSLGSKRVSKLVFFCHILIPEAVKR